MGQPGAIGATFLGHRRHHGGTAPPPPPPPGNPLLRYPAFDRGWIPYSGGAFAEPALPATSGSPVVCTTAAQVQTQMALGGKIIQVAANTAIGAVNSGSVDCEIIIPAGSSIAWIYLANPFSATSRKYTQRLRVRGPGKLGGVMMIAGSGVLTSTDIIFDGLVINPSGLAGVPGEEPFANLVNVQRMLWMNCVGRVPLVGGNGNGFITYDTTDFGIFHCNFATNPSEGPTNSWLWRLGGASSRILAADNYLRKYATQQAIFRQGFGTQSGVFFRGNTFVSGDELVIKNEGTPYDVDETYFDLNTIVFTGAQLSGQTFAHAGQFGGGGVTHRYTATRTAWRATNSSYVNDSVLHSLENQGSHGETLSYRNGGTYLYDATFANLVPAWPNIYSPLTGATLPGDPALLP